jgi:hypothetical protein
MTLDCWCFGGGLPPTGGEWDELLEGEVSDGAHPPRASHPTRFALAGGDGDSEYIASGGSDSDGGDSDSDTGSDAVAAPAEACVRRTLQVP